MNCFLVNIKRTWDLIHIWRFLIIVFILYCYIINGTTDKNLLHLGHEDQICRIQPETVLSPYLVS